MVTLAVASYFFLKIFRDIVNHEKLSFVIIFLLKNCKEPHILKAKMAVFFFLRIIRSKIYCLVN